jgi:hypothetical protein
MNDVADSELASTRELLASETASNARRRLSFAGTWALVGLGFTLLEAIVRLGQRAAETLGAGLELGEWFAFFSITLGLIYFEGYRALQHRFVPTALARAHELSPSSPRRFRCLAPLYAACLLGAPRSTLIRAWLGVTSIVLAVVAVRHLPTPWRGIIDGAVAAALTWGLVALTASCAARSRS